MEINNVFLGGHEYRYAFYRNNSLHAPFGIFLMGNLQEIESVKFFSEKFSESLNLFVVEVPGTGLTNPLPAVFNIQEQANLLRDFIEEMNIDSAHVLAFSYATPIALELCVNWAGAITLTMCGGMAGIPTESRLATMAILSDAIRDKKKFADEFISRLTCADELIPRGKVIARSARQKVHRYSEKQVLCFCENTVRILSYKPSDISGLKIPCLLFIGEKDPYVTVANAKKLVDSLPNCEFSVVKNADHLVHLEHPERTAELMLKLTNDHVNYYPLNKGHINAGVNLEAIC